ncbi:MAG: hypothetical protein J6X24_06605 [Firmicutes bacterium]|nr:hypothetical protein [Bacillota bacterium]
MKDLLYLTWLSILPGLSADRKLELMRAFGGAKGVFDAPQDALKEVFAKNGILSSNAAAFKRLIRKDAESAQRCLKQAKKPARQSLQWEAGNIRPCCRRSKTRPSCCLPWATSLCCSPAASRS